MELINYHFLKIPPYDKFEQWLTYDYIYSDMYGALHVAAEYCGIKEPPLEFPGIWLHGCHIPWNVTNANFEVGYVSNAYNWPVFTTTLEQEKLLASSGYQHARAIGLPFVYLPDTNFNKIEATLGVFPIHSSPGVRFDENTQAIDEYASFISDIAKQFKDVIVVLHIGDIVNKQWVEAFGAYGIHCVQGAAANDKNALLRIKMLMQQFEYVTSNGWGSHIAYALSCGAKVSIAGPAPRQSIDAILADPGVGDDINQAVYLASEEFKNLERQYLSNYFLHPRDGVIDIETGNSLIGLENKVSSRELLSLFKWDECIEDSVNPSSFDASGPTISKIRGRMLKIHHQHMSKIINEKERHIINLESIILAKEVHIRNVEAMLHEKFDIANIRTIKQIIRTIKKY